MPSPKQGFLLTLGGPRAWALESSQTKIVRLEEHVMAQKDQKAKKETKKPKADPKLKKEKKSKKNYE